METMIVLDDAQIRMRRIEILNDALGPALALRFLSLVQQEPTDYVEVSQRLYENQTIDDIFARAKEQWHG